MTLIILFEDLKPLRQKNYDVEDKYERAKRSYDSIASSTQNAISNLMNDVEITRKLIENVRMLFYIVVKKYFAVICLNIYCNCYLFYRILKKLRSWKEKY